MAIQISGSTIIDNSRNIVNAGIVTATTFSGDVAVSDGSASAPSIRFSDSSTTGIYSPGTNQFAIATNGVGRITIDASGNVVAGGTLTAGSFIPTSSTVPTNGVYLPAANSVALSTNGQGRLFVNASGNVGVNNASPSASLSVSGTSNDIAVFERDFNTVDPALVINNLSTNANAGSRVSFRNAGTERAYIEYQLGTGTTPSLRFGTAGFERLRITSAGLLGLGTSSPSTVIHTFSNITGGNPATSGSSDANIIARFQGASVAFDIGGTAGGLQWIQPRLFNNYASNFGLALCPNGGNVGIGTTSPTESLEVAGNAILDANNANLKIKSGIVGTTGAVNFTFNTDSTVYGSLSLPYDTRASVGLKLSADAGGYPLTLASNTSHIIFENNSTERARIDSSGRLLVGTSSALTAADVSKSKLVVNGDTDGSGYPGRIALNNSVATVLANYKLGEVYFSGQAAGNAAASIACYAESDWNTAGDPTDNPGYLVFSTTADGASSPTERMRIDSAGTTTLTSSTSTAPFIAKINTSEVARIDSSGRLLVGTSSDATTASASIVVQSSQAFGAQIKRTLTANDEYPVYFLTQKARGSSAVQSGDRLSDLGFRGYDGSNYLTAGTIECIVDGTPGTNDMPGRLVFSTTADGASSPTERMRISSSGRASLYSVLDTTLSASNSGAAGTTYAIMYGRYGATGVNTGTISYAVFTNGDVQNTNNAYGAYSDIKLKENIVDASSQWNDLKALQVRKYNFKEGQTHTQIGLIAQEVELVSPGLVSESPDRDADGNDLGTTTKSVNYSVLYMKAVKALQEAMERIETLEAKVAALETP